ncbi:hypothetical protein B0H34DRAFT_196190 [Crassisporium funariophilum]|nr:hypothetical protein B0H34DRAFT_196190 [Crassisporium funariophilum]
MGIPINTSKLSVTRHFTCRDASTRFPSMFFKGLVECLNIISFDSQTRKETDQECDTIRTMLAKHPRSFLMLTPLKLSSVERKLRPHRVSRTQRNKSTPSSPWLTSPPTPLTGLDCQRSISCHSFSPHKTKLDYFLLPHLQTSFAIPEILFFLHNTRAETRRAQNM